MYRLTFEGEEVVGLPVGLSVTGAFEGLVVGAIVGLIGLEVGDCVVITGLEVGAWRERAEICL